MLLSDTKWITMKVWYKAVCDEHKVMREVFVSNPLCTYDYLKEDSQSIQNFLMQHYGCELRLIWRDDQSDKCYNEGYLVSVGNGKIISE